ncbi:MAG: hypothetical protein JST04_01020 [Bdellovibrionales bacterium]|nr:hypothetical protein [Bdellovibrionales bacterium]
MRLPKILIVRGDDIKFNKDELRTIKEFRTLIERDKSKKEDGEDKQYAKRELTYVYFYCDYTSPYVNLGEEQRHQQSIKSAGLHDAWKPDKMVREAMKAYENIQYTPAIRSIREIRETLATSYEIAKIFNQQNKNILAGMQAKLNDFRSDNIKAAELAADNQLLIKNMNDTIKMLSDVEKAIKNCDTIEERIIEEVAEQNIRGGQALGNRELPEDQR